MSSRSRSRSRSRPPSVFQNQSDVKAAVDNETSDTIDALPRTPEGPSPSYHTVAIMLGHMISFSLRLESSSTVRDVKTRIGESKNIEAANQILSFKGRQLDDDCVISDLDDDDSRYILFSLDIVFPLTVNFASGASVVLTVQDCFTISQVQTQLAEVTHQPVSHHRLMLGDLKLDDYLKLYDYGIVDSSRNLTLVISPTFQLTVRIIYGHLIDILAIEDHEKVITLDVQGTDTLDDVKAMIYDREQIPVDQQELFRPYLPLDFSMNLEDNGFQHGSSPIQCLV